MNHHSLLLALSRIPARSTATALLLGTLAFAATAQALPPSGAIGATVRTEQVRAELLAHAPQGIAPGQAAWLGLKIEHEPEWHTYWKNPGDSGLPTTLTWTLPEGVTAGDIEWPTPRKLPVGPLMNYGYEGTVVLPVALKVPAGFSAAWLDVKLSAQWLVCKDVCIPQEGQFSLRVPAQAATAMHQALFDASARAAPVTHASTKATSEVGANSLEIKANGLPKGWQGRPLDVFVEMAGVVDHAAKPAASWQGDTWVASVPLSRERYESPTRLDAVLTTAGEAAGVRVSFDVKGTWPALSGAAAVAEAAAPLPAPLPGSPGAPAAASMGLLAALISAFIGGLLLNLMPCVLPVLSLKVLGLTQHTGDSARMRVGTGVAYAAGVVMSFLALAGLLLALRAGGQAVGWGFQLQSPGVVVALAMLFTLIGLNLAGTFNLSMVLPGNLASTRMKHPWADAWLTGVLAVAVAAPCTAPFMGAALGYAVSLPAAQALLVFAMLGLGLALPFLAVALVPALARWLPRPGLWMERFKVAMAFPMFATVVWLVWVLGQQVGIDGAATLLAVLVALAFLAWLLSHRSQGRVMRLVGPAFGVATLAAALAWAWPTWSDSAASPTAQAGAATDGWEPWSRERVAQHAAAGRTVFVDFTAAWCVTCQVNKRSTLNRDDVRALLAKHQVVTMRADWTRRDAAIAAELTRLGRSGVPVYAIYRPDSPVPTLLPEVLTPAVMFDAFDAPRVAARP